MLSARWMTCCVALRPRAGVRSGLFARLLFGLSGQYLPRATTSGSVLEAAVKVSSIQGAIYWQLQWHVNQPKEVKLDHLWPWSGKYFGYMDWDRLWTHDGRNAGRLQNGKIYASNGDYIGEVKNDNRLITYSSQKGHRGSSFTPCGKRIGIVPFVDYFGYVMYAGHEDFPGPSVI